MFDVFLALNGQAGVIVAFKVYQLLSSVSPGETWHGPLTMFINPPQEIVSHADIKCPARFVGNNVNKIVCHPGKLSWIAGTSPAMTNKCFVATQMKQGS
jgi:hypothetical protein